MKYIDADKIIAQIKGIIAAVEVKKHPDEFGSIEQCMGAAEIEALNIAIDCIKELQQEQPEVDLEKEYKTWWNSISGKINVEHMMEWYMHETARHF